MNNETDNQVLERIERIRQQTRAEVQGQLAEAQRQLAEALGGQDQQAEAQRPLENQFWARWQVREQGKLQEGLQSIERKLQAKGRDIQIRRQQIQNMKNLTVDPTVLEKYLQNEHNVLVKLMTEERELRAERTVLREELKGLPREQLRSQIRQRVDNVLSRQLLPEQLRHQVLELQESILRDFSEQEPQSDLLAAEFQTILREQWRHYDHPDQQLRIILEFFAGRGPNP